MTHALSSKTQLGIGKETTYGTPVSATRYMEYGARFVPRFTPNIQRIRCVGGTRDAKFLTGALKEVSGRAEFSIYHGSILEAVLGKLVTTGTGPYTHTFSGDERIPSLTIEYASQDLDLVKKYSGCKVSNFTLGGADLNTPLLGTLEWIGQKVTVDTWANKSNITLGTEKPYLNSGCQFELPGGTNFTGAVRSWTVRINNGLTPIVDVAGAQSYIDDVCEGNRDYELTLDIVPADKTLYQALINETEQTTAHMLYTRGTNDTLEIQMSNLKLTEGEHEQPADVGPIPQAVTMIPKTVEIVVVNNIANASYKL